MNLNKKNIDKNELNISQEKNKTNINNNNNNIVEQSNGNIENNDFENVKRSSTLKMTIKIKKKNHQIKILKTILQNPNPQSPI